MKGATISFQSSKIATHSVVSIEGPAGRFIATVFLKQLTFKKAYDRLRLYTFGCGEDAFHKCLCEHTLVLCSFEATLGRRHGNASATRLPCLRGLRCTFMVRFLPSWGRSRGKRASYG